jgi:anaerobic magnesium-protoporphyrin IX monomethyl ester cyclase
MKVLLVNTWCHSLKSPNEPMGLCYLASILRKNKFEVMMIDMIIDNLNYKDVERVVADYDVIGLAIHVPDYLSEIAKFVVKIKTEKNIIIAGGYEPTLNPEMCMHKIRKLDGIVIGEGEVTFLEILEKIRKGEKWQKLPGVFIDGIVSNRSIIPNLDILPMAARDYTKKILKRDLPLQIYSSRGCYGNCSFCSIYAFYSTQSNSKKTMWRCHSAERIIDEILLLQKTYNIKRISFTDDNFMGPKPKGIDRAKRFAKLIIEQNIQINFRISARMDNCPEDVMILLKKAGLNQVFSGAENGNNNVLKYFNKGITPESILRTARTLHKLGIDMQLGFIWFTDKMTLDELTNNIRFAEMIGPEYIYHPGNSRLRYNSGTRLTMTEFSSEFVDQDVRRVFNIINDFYHKHKELYETLIRLRFDYWGSDEFDNICTIYKAMRELELAVMKDAIKTKGRLNNNRYEGKMKMIYEQVNVMKSKYKIPLL